MKSIRIADATLREVRTLSFKEKMEIARQLENIRVDVVETCLGDGDKADTLALHTISSTLKNAIHSCTTGLSTKEIDATWDAIKGSAKPRIRIEAPVSSVQMEYLCHKKPPKMLELIEELVSHAASLCKDVEFAAGDAMRAEPEFLAKACLSALKCGAKVITFCDTAGDVLPDETRAVIQKAMDACPELGKANIAVECNGLLHMATASVMACFVCGVVEVKASIIPTKLPRLQSVVEVVKNKGESVGVSTKVNALKLTTALRAIDHIENLDAEEETEEGETNHRDVELDASSSIAMVNREVKKLGFDLSDEDKAAVYENFCRVAKNKTISKRDLEAIVANAALQVPPTYRLVSYVINNGNQISSTACVILDKAGQQLKQVSIGDGPIDAAFMTIEQILGHHYELDDFQIQAITKGRDSVGQALVKLRADGRLFSGTGISTDIVEASIRAYLNALNKIVYEE